jgi:hypothetical protein
VQDEIAKRRLELAQENLRILEEESELSNNLAADDQALAEARVALNETRAEIASQRREDEALLREIQREAAEKRREEAEERQRQLEEETKRIQELKEEYQDLIENFEGALDESIISQLDDFGQLAAKRIQALQRLEELRAEILKQAAESGEAIPQDFEESFSVIARGIEKEFEEAVKKLDLGGEIPRLNLKEIEVDGKIIDTTLGARAKEAGINVSKRLLEGLEQDFLDRQKTAFDKIKDSILIALQIDDEQAAFFVDQFTNVFASLSEISQINLDEELARQDALIDKQKERVRETERALNEEQKRQELGYANNVAALEEALKQENLALAAAERQRLETERKAANQRLVADSVQQASQLALAASKVVTAESGKGLVGIITAAAGLALLFSIISKAKANAAKFSQPQRLRKGAKLEGRSHEQGGVPLAVINKHGEIENLYEAEAGEILIGTQHSREHEPLLMGMNEGRYKGIPLYELAEQAAGQRFVSGAKETARKSKEYKAMKDGREVQILSAAYQNAAMKSSKVIIEYFKKRPDLVQLKEGKVLRQYPNGSRDILNFE